MTAKERADLAATSGLTAGVGQEADYQAALQNRVQAETAYNEGRYATALQTYLETAERIETLISGIRTAAEEEKINAEAAREASDPIGNAARVAMANGLIDRAVNAFEQGT